MSRARSVPEAVVEDSPARRAAPPPEETAELAIESSRRETSLALRAGARVFEDALGERAHASDLLPRLEALLAAAGVERRDGRLALARVFVGTGPGSYTGLRVGIATALGLARASGATLHGLSSFEALAWAELSVGEEGAVVLDARGARFYHARFARRNGELEVLVPPETCTAAELAARCALPGPLLGHPGLAEAAGLEETARLRTAARPSARALLELGRLRLAAGRLAPAAGLEPLYLREFGRD